MTEKTNAKRAATEKPVAAPNVPDRDMQGAFQSLAGAPFENARLAGEASTLFIRTAQDLFARQAAYLKANAEAFQLAASNFRNANPSERLAEHQRLYRETMQRSVDHVVGVAETISAYCCDAADQFTQTLAATVEKPSAAPKS